jgi:diaminohydroxyphosphoribosylaminopyrimidine deaminase / 5-amino-6-(5-phosphoribosylamino)uracil reductase
VQSYTDAEIQFMQIALNEAKKGLGKTKSNPMVGALLVYNGQIISKGYHQKFGEAHAEVNCLKSITDPIILQNSTLYVTLEPCFRFGKKTPPCIDLVLSKKIPRIVIASTDPNPNVSGKSIKILRQNSVEVIVGLLDEENQELNKVFFWFHTHKSPYITLKWAKSSDGFISQTIDKKQSRTKITSLETDKFVHTLRANNQAILIGYNTAITDNPSLTTRLVEGDNPTRIILDPKNQLPKDLNIFQDNQANTIILVDKEFSNSVISKYESILQEQNSVHFVVIDYSNFTKEFNNLMHKLQISSILVEGGQKTLEMFIRSNNWNEAIVITSNTLSLKSGVLAPMLNSKPDSNEETKDEIIQFYYNQK